MIICAYLSILVKKFGILRVQENWFYSYFGGFKHLDCFNLLVCCSLVPGLVWYVILVIFLEIQWHFSKLKKVNLGQVILG